MEITPRNCNRAYAAKNMPLDADFDSLVIDFKEMPMGSIQTIWRAAVGSGGLFNVYASNLPDVASFDPEGSLIDGSEWTVHNADGGRIWIRDRLAFRYALMRYTAGSMTAGNVDIIAIGKRT